MFGCALVDAVDAVDEVQQAVVLQCALDQWPEVGGALRLKPGFGRRDERVLRRRFEMAAQEPERQPDRQVGGVSPLQRDRLRLGREQVRCREPQEAGLARSWTANEQPVLTSG